MQETDAGGANGGSMLGRSGMVVAGLGVLGVSNYVYLALTARAVSPAVFANISLLWTVLFTLGIGAFAPFEQEVGRAVAHNRATQEAIGPVVRAAVRQTAVILGALAALIVVGSAVIVDTLFLGSWWPIPALLLGLTGLAAIYLSRGLLAGSARFTAYATQLGLEGFLRVAGVLALVVGGATKGVWFGMAMALPPVVVLLCTSRPVRATLDSAPGAAPADLGRMLRWLITSAVASQVLINSGPVLVRLLGDATDEEDVGSFLASSVIARVPLFLFASIQAVLLPALATAAALGDTRSFNRTLGRSVGLVGAVGSLGIAVAAVSGSWIASGIFGARYALSDTDLALLATSTVLFMLALTLQSGLVAIRLHAVTALGWTAGAAVLVMVAATDGEVVRRVELGIVAGCLTATLVFTVALARWYSAPAEGRS